MKRRRIASVLASAAVIAVVTLASASPEGQAPTENAIAKVRGGRFLQQLTMYDSAGNVLRTLGAPADYNPSVPVFSPDGTRVAVAKRNPFDIWVIDLSTGASMQVTSRSGVKWQAAWSPDSSHIAYVASREGYDGLYRKAANGTPSEELLYRHALGVGIQGSIDWSPDGRFLCFESGGVLFVLPVNGDRKAVELVREEYRVGAARFSPDGRFLAYRSDESGRDEVYVRAFDPSSGRFSSDGGKWQISDQGGGGPFWRRNGGELYYVAADGGVMGVQVATTPPFKVGRPKLLFPTTIENTNFVLGNVTRDGQQFVFVAPMSPPEREVVTVAPDILARYVGTYSLGRFDEDEDHLVTLQGNQLMMQMQPAAQKRALSAESAGSFFSRDRGGDTDFEFVVDDKGVVTYLVQYNGGPGTKYTRK